MQPFVSPGLLTRLEESFPADIVGLAHKSHDEIQRVIGEQRVLQVIQQWAAEQDPLQDQ